MSTADELLKWKQLLDMDAITKEEYEMQKQKVLFLPVGSECNSAQQTIIAPVTAVPTMQPNLQNPNTPIVPTIKKNKYSGWKAVGAILKGLMYGAILVLLSILVLEMNVLMGGIGVTF